MPAAWPSGEDSDAVGTRMAGGGHSVGVLMRVYAKVLDGGEQAARDRVERMLRGR